MSVRIIRDQFRKIKKQMDTMNNGFESDYYTYHNKLTHRKLSFKNMRLVTETDEECKKIFKRIFSLTIGYDFDIHNILIELNRAINIVFNESHNKNVIILSTNYDKTIFLFEYGVLVIWGFEINEEKEISSIFVKYCKNIINSFINNPSRHDKIFFFNKGEIFQFTNRNKFTIESNTLNEKLSISYALSQETILTHYENEVDDTIEETKHIPIALRDKGEISLDTKEISRYIGLIFNKRSAVNLNAGVLDTPDIQDTELENIYIQTRSYLEINKRIEILNKRMKLLKELYDVLNYEIKTQGKFRLEWIVVYLIVIEIFISLFWKILVKDILKLF